MNCQLISLITSNKKSEYDEGCAIINNLLENIQLNEAILEEVFIHMNNGLKSKVNEEQCAAIRLAIYLFSHLRFNKLSCNAFEKIKLDNLSMILHFVSSQCCETRLHANQFIKQICKNEFQLLMDLASEIFIDEIEQINAHLKFESTDANELHHHFYLAKRLDNILQCFKFIVDATLKPINLHVSKQLINCIKLSLKCDDRLTKESSIYLLLSIMKTQQFFKDICMLIQDDIVEIIFIGLSDNYSQVRLPACLTAKELFIHVVDDVKTKYLITLLPGLCLNRYYTAQGVSHLSQEIWVNETLGQGLILVEENFDSLISFYEIQLQLPNFEVHETVSICINEALLKLHKEIVSPHIERIVKMVDSLMSHKHWSVQDSACITTSSLYKIFNCDCIQHRDAFTVKLFDALVKCLPRVREAAAIALASMASSCGPKFQSTVINNIQSFLDEMFSQNNFVENLVLPISLKNKIIKFENISTQKCQNNHKNVLDLQDSNISKNDSTNLRKTLIYNDNILVGDIDSINLNSLKDVSIVLQNVRTSENWEIIEGYLCLICQLAKYNELNQIIIEYLLKFKELIEMKNYSKCPYLMQSLFQQLPDLFANLGKVYLKMYIEEFFDLIFENASSLHHELASASQGCILSISKQFGPQMFKMRVEKYNPNYVKFC